MFKFDSVGVFSFFKFEIAEWLFFFNFCWYNCLLHKYPILKQKRTKHIPIDRMNEQTRRKLADDVGYEMINLKRFLLPLNKLPCCPLFLGQRK